MPEPETPGDRHDHPQRNIQVDVLQIVRPCSTNLDLLRPGLASVGWELDPQFFREVPAGERGRILLDLVIGPGRDHFPAVLARARPQVENAVRRLA